MVKNPPANTGDARHVGLIPGSGRSPGEGNGNALQYSCLGNPWTEEPGGLQSPGSCGAAESGRTEHSSIHANTRVFAAVGNAHAHCQMLSSVRLFASLWTTAPQAPLCVVFSGKNLLYMYSVL